MKIKDVLRRKGEGKLVTIAPDQTLQEASHLLHEHNIGALLVTQRNTKLVGILSERDIVRQLSQKRDDWSSTPVKSVMTSDVVSGHLDDDLRAVMNVMDGKGFRHLPILDGEELIGMISIRDVIRALLSRTESEVEHLRSYITGTST